MRKHDRIRRFPKYRSDRFSTAWFVSLLYLLFGILWISSSDMIAVAVASSEEQLHIFSLIKGWLFIGLTTLLLWILLKIETGKNTAQQKKLEDTAARLKSAQAIAHLGSWELSGGEARLIWSDSVYELFGLIPGKYEPTVESSMAVVHPDDQEMVIEAFRASLESGSPYEVVHRIIRPDTGEIRYLHERCEHVLRADGTVLKSIGTVQDVTDRTVREQLLQERELRYRSLVEDSPVFLCNFSPDGTILFVNRAYCEYFRKEAEELVGAPFVRLVSEGYREKVLAGIRSLTAEQPLLTHEHPVPLPGGGQAWHRWTNRALYDEEGRLQSYQSFGVDITEEHSNITELNQSRKLLNDVFCAVPDLMWLKDENGVYLLCNPRFEELYGCSSEQITGQTDSDFVGVEQAEALRRYDRKAEEKGVATINEEFMTFASDGHEELLEVIRTPLYDDDGRLVGTLGVGRDITVRSKMKEELANSEERFRTIYENAPVLIDSFNENAELVLWNKACEETFGWSQEEVNAHDDALTLFYPDPEVRNEVLRTLTRGPDGRFREWSPVTRDGKTLYMLWANFTLPDGQVISIGHDITDLRKVEKELKQYQEQLEQRVQERTEELRRAVSLMAGRENRMAELKKEIRTLQDSVADAEGKSGGSPC
ncbi:PAS domain-containing protein [Pontiella agarivorans]|uniref:histidine kinase n=1 Tax=Pontiella agarivorans TaxID=3038953 RepID=A0ABU5MWX3_9BACT|nr:PAS domain S-box protein [Pontiella agarivorans]MDZ8118719.1 PAS domain S-box protein [Pontiella agarivorans]